MIELTCLCANPCVDRVLDAEGPGFCGTNRVLSKRVFAGGKGVNAAMEAARMGARAQCVLPLHPSDRALFEQALAACGAQMRMVERESRARENLKLRMQGGVTELNERGERLTQSEADALLSRLEACAHGSAYAALCGSIPPGCGEDFYARCIARIGSARCVLDASGEALKRGVAARPFLVKPNADELSACAGLPVHTTEEALFASQRLLAMGAQNVLASMGARGALLVTRACAYFAPAVDVRVQTTVGAGDAMLAGMLVFLARGSDLPSAFVAAVAAAAARVENGDTAQYEAYKKRVSCKKL